LQIRPSSVTMEELEATVVDLKKQLADK